MVSSAVALEALLEEGDPRFLDAVLETAEARPLRGLAERWYRDGRPEARRSLLAYIDDGLLRPNHPPLAKRLFKLAEAAQDHEAMAHLLVACDRMARRRLVRRGRYDWQTRTYREWEAVVPRPEIPRTSPTRKVPPVNGRCPAPPPKQIMDPWTGRRRTIEQAHLPTFTFRTRRYLARRAWRYFRTLAKADPRAYRDHICVALALYEDAHLTEALDLLDAWGLVHALYHHAPSLDPGRPGWIVRPGHALAELSFAPYLPEVWQDDPEPLFDLVARARARVVREFALTQLRAHHEAALDAVPLVRVRRFLSSPHEEVLRFGAELFDKAAGVSGLSITEWRDLLTLHNPYAAPLILAAFDKYVRPDRLSDEDLVELVCAHNAPAAQLALRWLEARPVTTREDFERRARTVRASTDVVRERAATWIAQLVQASDFTGAPDVRELFDAHHLEVRAKGLALVRDAERFAADTSLWVAMSETPYDDVRAALLAHLDARSANLEADELHRVWAAVLLAIHRGSRAKARAARQIARRLVTEPTRADELLPLLAVSLRSLRRPERRSALAAVARAVFAHPGLLDKAQAALPGLQLGRSEP